MVAAIKGCRWSKEGSTIATCSFDKSAKLLDFRNGRKMAGFTDKSKFIVVSNV